MLLGYYVARAEMALRHRYYKRTLMDLSFVKDKQKNEKIKFLFLFYYFPNADVYNITPSHIALYWSYLAICFVCGRRRK